jgi:hypothetical protein
MQKIASIAVTVFIAGFVLWAFLEAGPGARLIA